MDLVLWIIIFTLVLVIFIVKICDCCLERRARKRLLIGKIIEKGVEDNKV